MTDLLSSSFPILSTSWPPCSEHLCSTVPCCHDTLPQNQLPTVSEVSEAVLWPQKDIPFLLLFFSSISALKNSVSRFSLAFSPAPVSFEKKAFCPLYIAVSRPGINTRPP